MAAFARAVISVNDDGTRTIDYVSATVLTKTTKRGRPSKTPAERRARRDIVWLALVRGGLSYQQIAEDSGFSTSAVHTGVQRAKSLILARQRDQAD